MTLPVYLVASLTDAVVGGVAEIVGDEAHHAVTVRRSRVGEMVTLTDGRGGQATGPIVGVTKRQMMVQIDRVDHHPEPSPSLWVVQAIPKGDRGERAVEVLTEIGVARIIPWAAERSVGQWRGERAEKSLAKWRSTARESGKQARRTWAAHVDAMVDTLAVCELVRTADLAIVLHEDAEVALEDLPISAVGVVVLVVGPEGGLTEEEVAALSAAGGVSIKLGAEILRTSTAGVAACSAVLSRTPRWASG